MVIEKEITISVDGISSKVNLRIPVIDGLPDYERASYSRVYWSGLEPDWYSDMDLINVLSYSQLDHIRHEAKRAKPVGDQGDGTYKVERVHGEEHDADLDVMRDKVADMDRQKCRISMDDDSLHSLGMVK